MPRVGRVKLLKKIKHNDNWIFAAALFDSKGRVRRDHVTVGGGDQLHPEGVHFLQWWNAGVRTHEAVGPDAFVASERARKKQAELSAVRSGVIDTTKEIEHPSRVTVKNALGKYEDYIRYHRSLRTFRTYRPILRSFGEFCPHTYVDQVDRAALMDFATLCPKAGQNGKTIYNKLVVLCQLLKQHGRSKLLTASDWPSFVETVRPIYEDAELAKLFAACTPTEEARLKFYLMSGFRDAEGRIGFGRLSVASLSNGNGPQRESRLCGRAALARARRRPESRRGRRNDVRKHSDSSPSAFPANAQATACGIHGALGLGRETRNRPANPLDQNRHFEF